MRFVLLLCPLLFAGCANLPALDDRITPEARQTPAPALIPLDPIFDAEDTFAPQTAEQTDAELKARAAALRARAAQMRAEAAQ
ncbi:hypothetical protein [Thalassovita sp.]|uniref:hypothetical protein n=1 Tax=Thalassovita sp. TaxID=1979401 RepID=UPI0029DE7D54|nr:hypothetical protein [Thalassovita sp.]